MNTSILLNLKQSNNTIHECKITDVGQRHCGREGIIRKRKGRIENFLLRLLLCAIHHDLCFSCSSQKNLLNQVGAFMIPIFQKRKIRLQCLRNTQQVIVIAKN